MSATVTEPALSRPLPSPPALARDYIRFLQFAPTSPLRDHAMLVLRFTALNAIHMYKCVTRGQCTQETRRIRFPQCNVALCFSPPPFQFDHPPRTPLYFVQ
jgi:hypothetical protein